MKLNTFKTLLANMGETTGIPSQEPIKKLMEMEAPFDGLLPKLTIKALNNILLLN